jgi:Protein of unknown function (DUF4058)
MDKSPFPGMDPYLEGYLWPDVHNRLAAVIAELLAPQLAPKYVARIELYTVEDQTPESEIGILYPDVEVLQLRVEEPAAQYARGAAASKPDVVLPYHAPVPVRIPVVEIRDVAKNRLVTAIEILSPVNKKRRGSEKYGEKRAALHQSGVHLLEIDLLRRGIRPLMHAMLTKSDYAVFLLRAGARNTEVWRINLHDSLPVLPVPLKLPDPDAILDLKAALDLIYARGLYGLSIDYGQKPPPPDLSEEDLNWIKEHAKK